MSSIRALSQVDSLKGRCTIPGDKAISHRAAILAAMAVGRSRIERFSSAGDCEATLATLADLGVGIVRRGSSITIDGVASKGLTAPRRHLDCARSGTTIRLTMGLVAGASFPTTLTGDEQLLRRPMNRVAEPLRLMGAGIELSGSGRPPVTVRGAPLRGIEYVLPVASAQVKSAVLLAGLQASGTTLVVEPVSTRDHTERLLEAMGGPIRRWQEGPGSRVAVTRDLLAPIQMDVPGDFSSAAPLIALASLLPGSDLVIEGVGLNAGRTGFLRILARMGGAIEVTQRADSVEPSGNLRIRHGELQATRVDPTEVPSAIDELPLIGLLATQAVGVTEVRGAAELRVKESDRIAGLVAGLRAIGGDAEELEDGFAVRGPTPLRGGLCDALEDHRLAMTFRVASFIAAGEIRVDGLEFVPDSFPGFEAVLRSLR